MVLHSDIQMEFLDFPTLHVAKNVIYICGSMFEAVIVMNISYLCWQLPCRQASLCDNNLRTNH